MILVFLRQKSSLTLSYYRIFPRHNNIYQGYSTQTNELWNSLFQRHKNLVNNHLKTKDTTQRDTRKTIKRHTKNNYNDGLSRQKKGLYQIIAPPLSLADRYDLIQS